jgi:hypothetical protein
MMRTTISCSRPLTSRATRRIDSLPQQRLANRLRATDVMWLSATRSSKTTAITQ